MCWKPCHNNTNSSGTADIAGLRLGNIVGNAEFWVGNIHPKADEETIKNILSKCASDLKVDDFEIENITCLTQDKNPRSHSWKISVAVKFAETIKLNEIYPIGWNHRIFTPSNSFYK